MSFPNKNDRQKCWDAKDCYWECLDKNKESLEACTKLRAVYESSCPAQWVKHFDRKRSYLKYKDQVEKEGDMDKLKVPDSPSSRYLTTILTTPENIKFDVHLFKTLIQNEELSNESILHGILTGIFQLLEKCDKNFQMCSDLAYSFCITVSSLPHGTTTLFDILRRTKLNFFSECAGDLDHLIKNNYCVLVLGVLRFFSAHSCQLQPDQCEILNSSVAALVAGQLLDLNNVNILLCIVEEWLSVILAMEISEEILENVYTSVLSIAIIHWNIDISEFRQRVENQFLKCLCLNYEKDRRRRPKTSDLKIIASMKMFRAIAYDMFWSLPFKYYAYVVALKFVKKIYQLPKFLKHIREDLRVGFASSLRNKRVISVETELFKFCTNSVSFDDWREIFHPLIETILSSSSVIVANNFSRYWLPTIIRNFPDYAVEIFDRIPTQPNQRSAVHSRILFALFKVCHSRKIQFPSVQNGDQLTEYLQTFFLDAEDTRGELFALLCNLGEQSTMHSRKELKSILLFLKDNARSSSTILRQNLFSSFARFVLRLICSNVKVIRNDADPEQKLSHVLQFLLKLNEFFVDGLEPGCSYQRKLISLTLYKIFMTYALRDCGGEIRRNNLKDMEKFVSFASARNCWNFNSRRNCLLLFRCLMDPCEEIQNLAFTLLRTFFDLNSLNCSSSSLFSEVSELLNDSLFFKRNSGVSAVLSMICISYNGGNETQLQLQCTNSPVSNFTDMFLNILESQVVILQEDILNSALHHPLDSTIKILIFLMTHASSPESNVVTESQVEKLISLLEVVVPLLLQALFIDKFSDYAPSFEESDNALETIIQKSSIINELSVRDSELDEFQLKPVNQILLNFIWITLKVCSEIESYLISSQFSKLSETHLIRCSDLVVQKLKLCRHKGVIEAAGISLSNIVKILTEKNSCEKWLDSVISELISLIEHKTGATVSRKSAGLSLLIQNIVGNDRRPNKPLLVFCWTEFRRILNVDFDEINQAVLEELPQTHVLHFLKVLTADARNSDELSVFFEEIALVCLKALKAPIWTIRNAALQLFGAIVPKMVGQKNSQNDFGVRRSFEEVFLRMPALLHYIVSTFEKSTVTSKQKLSRDSDLVPLLIILANVQVSTVHLIDEDLFALLRRLRESLKYLLSSELHFVRELASESFVSLHCESESSIFKTIIDDVVEYVGGARGKNVLNENHLHGYLLVLKHAFSLYAKTPNFHNRVLSQSAILPFTPCFGRISLKSTALLYDLEIISCANEEPLVILNHMTEILDNLADRKHVLLGYDEWSYVMLQKLFKYCPKYSFLKFASYCLNSSHSTMRSNFLKILSIENASTDLIDLLVRSLKVNLQDFSKLDRAFTIELFKAFINLSTSCKVSVDQITFTELFSNLIRMDHYEYQATNLLVLCLMAAFPALDQLKLILREIIKLLDPWKSNRDVRFNSATALLSLLNKCSEQMDSHLIWLSIIEVVQDEEMDIRLIGCECYRSVTNLHDSCLNPEIVLEELFQLDIMQTVLPVYVAISILWDTLAVKSFDIEVGDEIVNPFDQGMLNVYKESCRTTSFAGQTLVEALQSEAAVLDANGVEFSVTHYYDSYIEEVLQNAERISHNPLLLSSESYSLGLRCYYLLLVFMEVYKRSAFSSSVKFNLDDVIPRAEKHCCSLRENLLLTRHVPRNQG